MSESCPHKSPGETLFIEPGWFVFADSRRENLSFPRAGRSLETFELSEHRTDSVGSLHAALWRHALPFEQEAQKVARLYRLDFGAQPFHGVAMDTGEES